MKKWICVSLSLALSLLTACAGKENVPAAEQTPPAPVTAPVGEPAVQPEPEPAEQPAAPESDAGELEKALACVDQEISALYDAVGEPEESRYEPSCSGPGDDGVLSYDGFIVFTYREDGVETVIDAEADS